MTNRRYLVGYVTLALEILVLFAIVGYVWINL